MELIERKYGLALTNQEKEFIPQIIDFFDNLGKDVCSKCENCEDCPFFENCQGVFGDDRPDVSLRIFFRDVLEDCD